jgi:hypothetical protein
MECTSVWGSDRRNSQCEGTRQMRFFSLRLCLPTLFAVMWSGVGWTSGTAVDPLQGQEWQTLAIVTGFHSVSNGKLGLAVRVLEADGSASVVENPVSLFVVVTNRGTSDLEERIWRLPQGVAQVRKVTACKCGLKIAAEVDSGDGKPGAAGARSRATIRACFLNDKGGIESKLRVEVEAGSGER